MSKCSDKTIHRRISTKPNMIDHPVDSQHDQDRIDEILIPKTVTSDYVGQKPLNSLLGIRRLNAFVGPNNSGKSRLLRELFFTAQDLVVGSTDEHSIKVRDAVRSCVDSLLACKENRDEFTKTKENLTEEPLGFHNANMSFLGHDKRIEELKKLATKLNDLYNRNPPGLLTEDRKIAFSTNTAVNTICRGVSKLASKSIPTRVHGQEQKPIPPRLQDAKYIYIPTLRGMRLSTKDENYDHAYFDRTWSDYIKGRRNRLENSVPDNPPSEMVRAMHHGKTIHTGLNLYDWLTNKLLGGLSDRELIQSFQVFLSKTFFRNDPVALIPRREHDTVHIKIGSEKERPVGQLGDGLQQLIILTLPIFEYRDVPLFLFIEEPDLFLHPGYQRVLIDTILLDKDRELYVFVTSHSSQFLDITLSRDDCAIFRCDKQHIEQGNEEVDPKFTVRNTTFGDQDILDHIGVRPSSVMFANCTIWVEGITDRLYFSRYIETILRDKGWFYTENLHYTFVEYGGGNITHWSFLDEDGPDVERLCAKLLLIADLDSGKEDRHQKLRKALGNRLILLPVRESENLLTPNVIEKVIRSYEQTDFQIKSFTQAEYKSRYLGRYIDSHVLVDKKQSKRYGKHETCYADKSGTIKNKVNFCRRALKHIQSKKDLSDDAIQLAERICAFIHKQNS